MKVLAGYLATRSGEAALNAAITIANDRGAQLLLVGYVPLQNDEHFGAEHTSARSRLLNEGNAKAAALSESGLRVSFHAPTGAKNPADALLRVARTEAADLVVIGLRKRSRVGKLVLGSNAQEILLRSDAPVLAVKDTPDHGYTEGHWKEEA